MSEMRPFHRMPTAFGPAPGPRNVPDGVELPAGPERRTTLAFTVEVHPDDLKPLLPRGAVPAAPRLTVKVQKLENLRWLAGRGYNIVSVSLPMTWRNREGDYLAVLWENLAEPIVTGRDELGFPKLFADIEAPSLREATDLGARASWDGTTFFVATAGALTDLPPPSPARAVVTHRYLPAVGRLHTADVDQMTVTEPAGPAGSAPLTVVHSASGPGRFAFHPVTWQQHPVQYPVINSLAGIRQTGPATVSAECVEGSFSAASNGLLD